MKTRRPKRQPTQRNLGGLNIQRGEANRRKAKKWPFGGAETTPLAASYKLKHKLRKKK